MFLAPGVLYLEEWKNDLWDRPYHTHNPIPGDISLYTKCLGQDNIWGGTGANEDILVLITSNRFR